MWITAERPEDTTLLDVRDVRFIDCDEEGEVSKVFKWDGDRERTSSDEGEDSGDEDQGEDSGDKDQGGDSGDKDQGGDIGDKDQGEDSMDEDQGDDLPEIESNDEDDMGLASMLYPSSKAGKM
jgi:hypothetical protein